MLQRILQGAIIILAVLYVIYYSRSLRERRPRYAFEPIQIQAIPITVRYTEIYRVPAEDIVDFEIEDRHNVHNKTIKRNIIQIINSLQEVDTHVYTIESALKAIRDSAFPEKVQSNAQWALQQVVRIDGSYRHTSGSIKELEVIRLVWERINHPVNKSQVAQLKRNFGEQLADCRDSNYRDLHCCEGRIARYLQSLEHCDQENLVELRPMWAYKEEITNKIVKYRDKLYSIVPERYKLDAKLDMTPHDVDRLKRFNECLVSNLERRFEKDYVQTGILTQSELGELTKVYYDSLYDY